MAECDQTLDGEHHYAPRKWQIKDRDGRVIPPWEKRAFVTVVACPCGKRPADEGAVKEQLAATAAERKRQADSSKQLLKENDQQGQLSL